MGSEMCIRDRDCDQTNCTNYNGCYDGIYRLYDNINNSCIDCVCTNYNCSSYIELSSDMDADGFNVECEADCNDSNPNEIRGVPL